MPMPPHSTPARSKQKVMKVVSLYTTDGKHGGIGGWGVLGRDIYFDKYSIWRRKSHKIFFILTFNIDID